MLKMVILLQIPTLETFAHMDHIVENINSQQRKDSSKVYAMHWHVHVQYTYVHCGKDFRLSVMFKKESIDIINKNVFSK